MGPRMPFSVHYGLTCLTMLLFLVAQVCRATPICCMTTSNAIIREPVNGCYLQKDNTIPNCNVEAYIFTTQNNKWCVDPRAWWIQQRLEKLAKRGIYCKTQ
ncbi:C-C motif chemokine 34b.8 [Micropterus dolomieu]|uniref:C-C motif chemokine 34b.8 n=1 Tax=Micropterus dolomieu TaxID=147949 RepID=UPI001E8EED0A|nr:C-C motif chemokine 34b.8 [Micropterus dolomieu]